MKKIMMLLTISYFFSTIAYTQLNVNANGRVGIGTKSQIVKLDVVDSNTTDGCVMRLNGSGTTSAVELRLNDLLYPGVFWFIQKRGYGFGSEPNNFYIGYTGNNGVSFTHGMSITTSGRVGLGEPIPLYKLDVKGDVRTRVLRLTAEDSTYAGIEGGQILFDSSSTSYKSWCLDVYQNRFRIFNPGFERFNILSDGKVGIGTATPSSKLEVNGSAQFDTLILDPQNTSTEGGEINFKGAGTYPTWNADVNAISFRLHSGGKARFSVDTSGVTTITDILKLTPRSTKPTSPSNGWIYYDSADKHLWCYTNGYWKGLDTNATKTP
ncbi:hypothetical protein HZA73_10435 [candidate division TA06 bacterium]|nr:hypothetical protein [candidate division TA06 bacterium]